VSKDNILSNDLEELKNLGITEAIFRSKQDYYNFYPHQSGLSSYDLERKDIFYGKIDKESDVVFADTEFLVGVDGAGDTLQTALDFVADAFFSFKVNFRKVARGVLGRDSVYYKDLKIHRSRNTQGLQSSYYSYMTDLYVNFVDSYLSVRRRYEKIKNYRDFVREFSKYCLKISNSFPITFSGYIASLHCSPLATGLMLEVSPSTHGIENNKTSIRYITDNYFGLWASEAAKFGFMIDRNSPWRLVFNLGSGYQRMQQDTQDIRGAQLFLSRHGLSYDNVFQYRFLKCYQYDMLFLKNVMQTLYEGFYQQYSTYEEEEAQIDKSARCISKAVVFLRSRKIRETPARFINKIDDDNEYWLKLLLKFKLSETDYTHDAFSYSKLADEMITRKRLFGDDAAMRYINNLTKGFLVTKFNKRGGFWQGVSEKTYNDRKNDDQQIIENAANAPLTGTKNSTR